jgi:hypothetical protein
MREHPNLRACKLACDALERSLIAPSHDQVAAFRCQRTRNRQAYAPRCARNQRDLACQPKLLR